MAITLSYIGARGDHLPLGGTVDTVVNINQLDPKYLALGAAALSQPVPNPFFGNPTAGPLSTQATLTRAQLLRPFPQFLQRPGPPGHRRHQPLQRGRHRVEQAADARAVGGRVSYTYSVLKDNQIGETNFYTEQRQRRAAEQLQLHRRRCRRARRRTSRRLLQPAGRVRLRHPRRAAPRHHRADLAAAVRQGPAVGQRAASANAAGRRLDDRGGRSTCRAASRSASRRATNTLLAGDAQRPNLDRASTSRRSGDLADRLASADHPTATWINPAAFIAGAGRHVRQRAAHRSPTCARRGSSTPTCRSSKNIRLGGGKSAQIKLEVINLFNRVQTNSISVDAPATRPSARSRSQSGFMRITQIMFRFSF